MPGLEILLAGSEFFLDFLDEVILARGNRGQQPDGPPSGRVRQREDGKFRRSLGRGGGRGCQRRDASVYGLFPGILTTRQSA